MKIDYGDICTGISAASVAWGPLGFKPAWFSEIEKFPCEVLKHHWPHVPNLGSMLSITDKIVLGGVKPPLILVGGTPCQAFSIAGKQLGLDDERGQLTLAYVDIMNAIDNERGEGDECVCVWENVPGVLSDKGNAFGYFLAKLAGEDSPLVAPGPKWSNAGCVFGPQRSIAWRVMDAQYFGVAQRRRRVFLVASARKGFDPTKVLFEFEGVRRDFKPRHTDQTAIDTGSTTPRAFDMLGFGQYGNGTTANTLKARDYKDATLLCLQDGRVRKLLPKEYARLQGFPDNHCALGTDAEQYKAYGNSMAVPCMAWIGKRLKQELGKNAKTSPRKRHRKVSG